MKKLFLLALTVLGFAACQMEELTQQPSEANDAEIYASMETLYATRTSMDQYNNVLWSEGDQIVAFMKTTLGVKYQIKEQFVGSTSGGFSKVTSSDGGDDLESGQEIDHNIVVYPYSDQVWCMKYDNSTPANAYKLNVVMPQIQTYTANSFADDAFPMIAVSSDNKLTFRNICGGVKLQFKGVDKIKSIKLEGLGNEKISGKSSVVGYADGSAPSITMASDASGSITLDCEEGVQLSPDSPVTFIISVPPVEFKSGMKIMVTDTDGLSRTLTNTSANTIKRSSLLNFPVITYTQEGVFEIPEGTLTSYEIPAEGGTIEIPVITNQEYEVVIPDDAAEWISLAQTKALREDAIILDISENATSECRMAEVLIVVAEGDVLSKITIKQDPGIILPDYIDEYGINRGSGIEINGVIWAPVNCGYSAGYKYGKLYQWGRKYGQGYDGTLHSYSYPSIGEYSDEAVPEIIEGGVSVLIGNDISTSNMFYTGVLDAGDWTSVQNDKLWNEGTEESPIKTEFDPCPEGWRVPTNIEFEDLIKRASDKVSDMQLYYLFYGPYTESDTDSKVILQAAGSRKYNGEAIERGYRGDYYSSGVSGSRGCGIRFDQTSAFKSNWPRSYARSIRCVWDDASFIEVSSITISRSTLLLEGGESYTIFATIAPSNANHQHAYWWSSNPDVATVDSDGKVIAVSKGNAVITAMAGMQTATCEVVVTSSVPKDYIDEYNVNYGAGVNIDGVIWAPVNCGYHKTGYPYGKLYQWGRRHGQGYSGKEYKNGSYVECNDGVIPNIIRSSVSLTVGQDVANKNNVYLPDVSDWTSESSDKLWNSGSESLPIKTEYDPCPSGWRIPTYAETKTLGKYVQATNENGQVGYYFSGSKEYAEADSHLFLPFGGRWTYFGYADDRGSVGYYWTSRAAADKQAYYALLYSGYILLDDNIRMYGCSVRCVQE